MDLTDKVVLVAGASKGVGRETALLLATEGARVVAVARDAEALETLAQVAKGRINLMPGDLTDGNFVDRLAV
ncbi:MAG: SDR family NAD(P)-dependent oxidoreductase, partial [Alphaproteobacteria bacterium]|nr:SDR family NAD(P)-dependent oxidoreductase [Alphaproteobacteria bacterium]